MMLRNIIVGLRNDPRLLKLPPYLSLLCILVGIAWLLVLPLQGYSRRTYISENALLPGQVNTYFGGSEHDVFRAYRHEVASLRDASSEERVEKLGAIFQSQGLKWAPQRYRYETLGRVIEGQNVYALLQGPRADATEATVLVAAWRNMDNVLNQSGVALVLTLARYLARWSLWSKDILFVITEDSITGPQAWVDAYHSTHDPTLVDDLRVKSGALQGVIALDYTAGTNGHRFEKIHVVYDGINGQLPNLDLVNSVVSIADDHNGIECTIQNMWEHRHSYAHRLRTMLRGIVSQGAGQATGPHSSFIPYHVDAITLQTVGEGWHDEMSLGKVVESAFRSLNNLLEHFHQSFFLYLLVHVRRFVSIATYLPSAMLIAANFTITSITLWVFSGRPRRSTPVLRGTAVLEESGFKTVVPKDLLVPSERKLSFVIPFVGAAHLLGLLPFYLLNNVAEQYLPAAYYFISFMTIVLPLVTAYLAVHVYQALNLQTLTLIPCISNLLLGVTLSTLSTLNFSLGLIVGLLASPLSFIPAIAIPAISRPFVDPAHTNPPATAKTRPFYLSVAFYTQLAIHFVAPPFVLGVFALLGSGSHGLPNNGRRLAGDFPGSARLWQLLIDAAAAWNVNGTWTSVVVWCVWWPAWMIGSAVGACGLLGAGADGGPPAIAGKAGSNRVAVAERVVAEEGKETEGGVNGMVESEDEADETIVVSPSQDAESKGARKRGRPRKKA